MSRPTPSQTLLGVAVVVVAAVVTTGAVSHGPSTVPSAERPSTVPLTDSTLVCPSLAGSDFMAASLLSASAPGTSGRIEVRRLGAAAAAPPVASLPPGGSVVRVAGVRGAKSIPLLVRATGDRARGTTANILTRVSSGVLRSVSSVPCSVPTGDTWLVGGSTVSGRRDMLLLTNADAAPAVVDVSVFGPAGLLLPSQGQGLTVPAASQVQLQLDALAPGLAVTTVQVHVRSGRVAAALKDTAAIGSVPAGVDWVPPSTGPATHQVVGGIPGESVAHRVLVLLVPGQDDATVRVRFATPDGTLSPGSVNALAVPAGRVTLVDLDKAGVPGPWSLLVDADHPFVAGVQTAEGGKGKNVDLAWAGGSPTLVGSAVMVPWSSSAGTVRTSVQLTAAGPGDVVVRVTSLAADGTALPPQDVTVPAGRQVQVLLGTATSGVGRARVEAPPGSGLVVTWYSIELGAHGPLITGGPLLQAPLTVPQPPAVADPSVGFPGH